MLSSPIHPRLLLVFVLAALVAGCGAGRTARGGAFEPPQVSSAETAQLVVYRPKQQWREKAGSYPEVLVDGTSMGILRYNGYLVWELPTGHAGMKVTGFGDKARNWEFKDRELSLHLKQGETIYVRMVVRYDEKSNVLGRPGMDYMLVVHPVSGNDAIYELKDMRESL